MEKLKMHSSDVSQDNIAKIEALFPHCVTEARDEETGELRRAIDFDQLKQELSDHIVEGPQERYRLDWPGKREAMYTANKPCSKTLRPVWDQSIDFNSANNLLIEGDNLEVLKVLQESFLGRVKLIYIDPPYNTGRDFIYDDDYSKETGEYLEASGQRDSEGSRLVANTEANGRFHSDWLSMLYPRLRLAKNLLADDGVVFISIDDNEVDNLRKLGNEIFGESNFVATIVWQKVYSPKNSAKWFSEDHDFVLVFAKNKESWFPNALPRTEEMEARYKNPDNDPRGPWKAENMTARNPYDAGIYAVTSPSGREIKGPPKGRYWAISKENFEKLDADNRIWWGKDGNNIPAVKKFLSEVSSGRTPQTLWFYEDVGHTQDAKKTLLKYVPFENTENVLNSVKPVALLQRIVQMATKPDENAIVMDFFSGSAPTPHAVLEQNRLDGGNRRFIGVQVAEPLRIPEPNMETIFDMGRSRLVNVINELKENNVDVPGFRVLKLDESNMKDVYYRPDQLSQGDLLSSVDNVKPDRTPEDLLFQVLVDWGVDLTLPIRRETIQGKTIFFVDENALVACFDTGVTEELVKDLAKNEPLRVVFRDNGFESDAVKINVEQIFRQLSPTTEVRAI
ncbi:site-specific DNA-methyltransferase [Marinobacter nauticus]|uniref:site-specific DNA-methyltransferase n=1 Tax=Marinobacter nauticus TaxID=2743 RepID=UPI000C554339|nr:site-specific DNA-methyltransferase [Marinobacter sp.]|tara:strand:+ start:6541 stop:8406 length:1866 start_codon:yes stop_codon:yes gene_type:complete